MGTFTLLYESFPGRVARERYASEGDARAVAATLWAAWVMYHDQRGAYTEVGHGGIWFRHHAIRRHVQVRERSALARATPKAVRARAPSADGVRLVMQGVMQAAMRDAMGQGSHYENNY